MSSISATKYTASSILCCASISAAANAAMSAVLAVSGFRVDDVFCSSSVEGWYIGEGRSKRGDARRRFL